MSQSPTLIVDATETVEDLEIRLGLRGRSLSKKEAAARLGVGERSFDAMISRGEIAAYRVNAQKLSFLGGDIARLLLARRVPIEPRPPAVERKPRVKSQPPVREAQMLARVRKGRRPRTVRTGTDK
jgi:excisionase family DNA binding protein